MGKEPVECWTIWRFGKRQIHRRLTKHTLMKRTWMPQLLNASSGARFDSCSYEFGYNYACFFPVTWSNCDICSFIHCMHFLKRYIKVDLNKDRRQANSFVYKYVQLASKFQRPEKGILLLLLFLFSFENDITERKKSSCFFLSPHKCQ